MLLQPPPYPKPDRLVIVNRTYPDWQGDPILARSWDRISLAWPEFFFLRDHARTIDALAVRTTALGLLPPDNTSGAREITVAVVSAGYLPLFGVHPVMGRFFEQSDDLADRKVALVDEGFWRTRLGRDPGVIGRTLPLADGARTVIGIVPASFRMPRWSGDVWEPLGATPESVRAANNRNLDATARLRDGATIAAAQAEMDGLLREIFHFPQRTGAAVTSLAERQVAAVRTPLYVLLAGAILLLVMACSNVAGFLVGDAAARVPEMHVRAALGAGRGRLLRQLLVETGLLAVSGGALGLLIAAWTLRGLVALAPKTMPRMLDVSLDARAFAFGTLAAAVATLLAGTIPALLLSGGTRRSLGAAGRVTPAHRRAHARLIIAQVSLGITLVAGAALFVRTLDNLDRVDAGFRRDHLVVARATLPQPLYTEETQFGGYFQRAETAIAGLPGVTSAAVGSTPPFANAGGASTSIVLGADASGGRRSVEAQRRYVSPSYFGVMEMPILQGRGFLPSDPPSGDVFVVVSRDMARRFWNGDAIGKGFSQGKTQFVVIGVTADVRDLALSSEPKATFYVSTVQRSPWSSMRVIARTSVPPSALIDAVRKTLAAVDPGVPIEDVATMDGLIFTSLDEQRYRALLLTIMASVAALLASVGLYGALARAVAERRREIGVRLALGARPAQVMALVLRDAARSAAGGAVLGLLGTAAIARVSATLLFRVGTLDAATVLVVCASAAAIVVAGGYFPARRASRVDPAVALRIENA